MKNTTIRNAWDTVNPTAAQKKRMRAALEARLNGREEPEKPDGDYPDITTMDLTAPEKRGQAKKHKPRYQSVQPAKSRGSGFALIAAMLAVVIAGGLFLGVMQGGLEKAPSFAQPSATETVPEATWAGEMVTLPDAYQKIVDTYVTAIEESWAPTKCIDQGICYLVKDIDRLDALGYGLLDLDENGTQELFITDGDLIYELYTLTTRGETVRLAQSIERDRFYLSRDNVIVEYGSSGAGSSAYHFSKLEENRLKLIDAVIYSVSYDAENPWFRGEAEAHITEEEANAVLESYPHLYIPHTTLSGEPPRSEAALPDEETLNEYARQLSSLVAGVTKENYRLYCFLDWDADGEEELLLGTGGSVYASLEADREETEGKPMRFNSSGAAYPCEYQVMEIIGYSQGYTQFSYRKYGGEKGGAILDYVFTDGENWYRWDENDDSIAISESEAKAIRAKYKRLNLPWKSLSEFPVTIPESGEAQALFERVFLPIAASGEKITEDELKAKTEENGFQWIVSDGQIYCYSSDSGGASIRANLGSETGELGDELIFFQPGTIDRWVAVCWEADGVHYLTGIDAVLNGIHAGSVEELQDFLVEDENTLILRRMVEGFARAYFSRDKNGMEEWTAANVTIENGKLYYGDLDPMVVSIGGLEDGQEQYEKNGYIRASVEVYPEEMKSYEFLDMNIVKENDQWKVQSWSLQR